MPPALHRHFLLLVVGLTLLAPANAAVIISAPHTSMHQNSGSPSITASAATTQQTKGNENSRSKDR